MGSSRAALLPTALPILLLLLLSALVLASPAAADVSGGEEAHDHDAAGHDASLQAFSHLHSLHSSVHHGRSLEVLNATNQTACGSMCDVFETYRSYRNLFLGYLAGPDNCSEKCTECISYNDTVFSVFLGNLTGGINPESVQYYNCTGTGAKGAHPTMLLFPALATALLAAVATLLLGL